MNTLLWSGLILLLALALVFVLLPVWVFRSRENAQGIEVRKQKNIEVFEQSQQDLEKELSDGLISKAEFEKLQTELKRSFLRDMEALEKAGGKKSSFSSNRLLPIAMAILVPIISIGIYQSRGAGPDLLLPQLMEEIRSAESQEAQEEAINRLLAALQARFDRKPDDVQSGYMLGTMYIEMQQYDNAIETFDRMLAQMEDTPDKATVYGQKAQALYLAAGQQLTDQVQATADRALALNPDEQAVMSVLAVNALISEQYSEALDYWKRQLTQLNPGSQRYQMLQQRIAQLQELIPEAELSTDNQVASNAGSSVEVSVDLDASIAGDISQDMRVFVFARDPSSAMPAPVAAQTFSVSELPATVILDDSSAMMAGRNLSTAASVVVGARISQSGNAIAQSGDYQAISEPLELGEDAASVSLVIKDRVP